MSAVKKFASLVETSRSGNIFLVTGGQDDSGRDAWYYIQVEPLKTSLFQKSIKSGSVQLDQFGQVLESGFGKIPPQKTKDLMKEKYNFEAGN